MKIAATMIDRVAGSHVTDDGRHVALQLTDADGADLTLGLPGNEIPRLIDQLAHALGDRERLLRGGPDASPRQGVIWWNMTRERAGDFVLSLTFGTGGTLDFGLARPMAAAMFDTLRLHFGDPAAATPFTPTAPPAAPALSPPSRRSRRRSTPQAGTPR